MSRSLQPHGQQQARLCRPSLSPRASSNLCPLSHDAIEPSHPLSSPSPPALNLSQHQGLFPDSAFRVRWPKYWTFSFSISPSNEYSVKICFKVDWLISLQSKGLSRLFFNTTVQKHLFFSTLDELFDAQPSLWSNSHICT